MEKQLDYRIQRTYTTLTNALLESLKEKSFDNITVGELCEKAMVRRATFYKHFGDKYELYAFVIRSLQEQFKKENEVEYDHSRPQTFYVAMIDCAFQFVEQHSQIFTSLMHSNSSKMLLDILSAEVERDILLHLKADEAAGAILPTKPELLATMITGAMVNTMKWWVMHDKKMPREEMTALCSKIIKFM